MAKPRLLPSLVRQAHFRDNPSALIDVHFPLRRQAFSFIATHLVSAHDQRVVVGIVAFAQAYAIESGTFVQAASHGVVGAHLKKDGVGAVSARNLEQPVEEEGPQSTPAHVGGDGDRENLGIGTMGDAAEPDQRAGAKDIGDEGKVGAPGCGKLTLPNGGGPGIRAEILHVKC